MDSIREEQGILTSISGPNPFKRRILVVAITPEGLVPTCLAVSLPHAYQQMRHFDLDWASIEIEDPDAIKVLRDNLLDYGFLREEISVMIEELRLDLKSIAIGESEYPICEFPLLGP